MAAAWRARDGATRRSISCGLASHSGDARMPGDHALVAWLSVFASSGEGRHVVQVSSRLRRAGADRADRICRMRDLQVREPDELEQCVYEHVGFVETVVTSAAQSAAKVTVRSSRPLAR